jgi:hypothetical protein
VAEKIFQLTGALMLGFVVASFGTVFAAIALEAFWPTPRPPIPRAMAEARLADEEAVATALGFVRESEEDVRGDGPVSRPLTVDPGECIAVLAGFHGASAPRGLAIVPVGPPSTDARPSDALAAQPDLEGVVGHVEWCADRRAEVQVDVGFGTEPPGEPEVILRVLRAPADAQLTNERLARGWIVASTSSVLGEYDAGPPDVGIVDAGTDAAAPDAAVGHRRQR